MLSNKLRQTAYHRIAGTDEATSALARSVDDVAGPDVAFDTYDFAGGQTRSARGGHGNSGATADGLVAVHPPLIM